MGDRGTHVVLFTHATATRNRAILSRRQPNHGRLEIFPESRSEEEASLVV